MSYSYYELHAHNLRERYHASLSGEELPVPVEAIADDLLRLMVEVRDDLAVSGMLISAERRIVVRADESPLRRRFRIAYEFGRWICQCLEGGVRAYCRTAAIGVDSAANALQREANAFAANVLMPEPAVNAAAQMHRVGVSDEALAWPLFNLKSTHEAPS